MTNDKPDFLIRFIGLIILLASLSFIPSILTNLAIQIIVLVIGIALIAIGMIRKKQKGYLGANAGGVVRGKLRKKFLGVGILLTVIVIASWVFSPILSFFQLITDIFTTPIPYLNISLYPLILLIGGIVLIIKGSWFYKILGLILLFIFTIGGAESVSGIADFFSSLKDASYTSLSSWVLFIIATLIALIFLFKIRGKLSKILGILLLIMTLPFINSYMAGVSPEGILGLSAWQILLSAEMIICAILLLVKSREIVSKTFKWLFYLLALLLIAFSFPSLINGIFKGISLVSSGFVEFIDGYTTNGFSRAISAGLIGFICFVGGKQAWGMAKGAPGWLSKKAQQTGDVITSGKRYDAAMDQRQDLARNQALLKKQYDRYMQKALQAKSAGDKITEAKYLALANELIRRGKP